MVSTLMRGIKYLNLAQAAMTSNDHLPDSNIKHFNIRVYGILHNDRQEVLIERRICSRPVYD